MREIKFRGREQDGFWTYGDLRHEGNITGIIENGIYSWVDSSTVGQFTGLYDCTRSDIYPKGRPIYEGDILNIDGEFIAEVVYCDGAYELYTKQGPLGKLGDIAYEYSLAIVDGVIETFSVIGNIHDNPGLLERKP